MQIIFRKVADLKHEQELDQMQQQQPQQEFSQDHIVRRLISKFRKPSDAGAIGALGPSGSGNTLQVPPMTHGPVPTISGALEALGERPAAGEPAAGSLAGSGLARSLAGKQSRWSQLVASAAAGAAGSRAAPSGSGAGTTATTTTTTTTAAAAGAGTATTGGRAGEQQPAISSTRSLLDIAPGSGAQQADSGGSNRSSADGRDDEVDENYFRPGGKGHQALLDNMDRR